MSFYVFWRLRIKPTSTMGRIMTPNPCADLEGPFKVIADAENYKKKVEALENVDKAVIIKGELI